MNMKRFTPLGVLLLLFLGAASACLHAQSSPAIGLKTNLASWLTLAPNLGAEVCFGKHYSIAADGSYGWWGFSGKQNAMQSWSIGGEAAYWFRPDGSFTGHHLGISLRGGQFDFKYGDTGRRGQAWLAGLAYGHSWRLRGNWLIDAGIGAGYARTDYSKYQWDRRYNELDRIGKSKRNRFGLTDLHVSLIYRLPTQ